MEKYYVIYVSNGNLAIGDVSEHGTIEAAVGKFHDVCALMWKDVTVQSAAVTILDNNMVPVNPYREEVHKAQAEPAKSTKKSAKSE